MLYIPTPNHLNCSQFIKNMYILTKCRVNLRLSEFNDVPKYRRFFQSYVKKKLCKYSIDAILSKHLSINKNKKQVENDIKIKDIMNFSKNYMEDK